MVMILFKCIYTQFTEQLNIKSMLLFAIITVDRTCKLYFSFPALTSGNTFNRTDLDVLKYVNGN